MSSSRGQGRIPKHLLGVFSFHSSTSGGSTAPGSSSMPSDSPGSTGMSTSVAGLSLGSTGPMPPGGVSSSPAPPPTPRVLVTLAGDGSLEPASKVAHAIGNIIKQFVDAEGYAWRFVSEDTKRLYLDEFQKLFYWDPVIDAQVKRKFYSKAAERYKDWVCKTKAKRYTKGKPDEISEGAWESWCAYWDLASTQEVTRKAKKNRLADVDGPGSGPSTHRGGSRSAASYAAALAKERGVPLLILYWTPSTRCIASMDSIRIRKLLASLRRLSGLLLSEVSLFLMVQSLHQSTGMLYTLRWPPEQIRGECSG